MVALVTEGAIAVPSMSKSLRNHRNNLLLSAYIALVVLLLLLLVNGYESGRLPLNLRDTGLGVGVGSRYVFFEVRYAQRTTVNLVTFDEINSSAK